MSTLDFGTIDKERFLKLSLDSYLQSLNKLVGDFFNSDSSDLSYSVAFEIRDTPVDISSLTLSVRDLISDLRLINSEESDDYTLKFSRLKTVIDVIGGFNSILIQIENSIESDKKFLKEIIYVYELIQNLSSANQFELAKALYVRFYDFLSAFEQTDFLIEKDEFSGELVLLLNMLIDFRFSNKDDFLNITLEDVFYLLSEIDKAKNTVSLKTRILLTKLLKIIIGKMIDSGHPDSEILSDCYVEIRASIYGHENLDNQRKLVSEGILRLESIIGQKVIFQTEYVFYKNLLLEIEQLTDLNDYEWLIAHKEQIEEPLLFIKDIYIEDGSNSMRNNKRIDYINKILHLLNGI